MNNKASVYKFTKPLVLILYCISSLFSVITFVIYRLYYPIGVISFEHPLYTLAGKCLIPLAVITPILTVMLMFSYKQELGKYRRFKFLAYVPWVLIWGEFVLWFLLLATGS